MHADFIAGLEQEVWGNIHNNIQNTKAKFQKAYGKVWKYFLCFMIRNVKMQHKESIVVFAGSFFGLLNILPFHKKPCASSKDTIQFCEAAP